LCAIAWFCCAKDTEFIKNGTRIYICSKNQLQTRTLAANIFMEILSMLRGGGP